MDSLCDPRFWFGSEGLVRTLMDARGIAPKALLIPAWGNAPGSKTENRGRRAESPLHHETADRAYAWIRCFMQELRGKNKSWIGPSALKGEDAYDLGLGPRLGWLAPLAPFFDWSFPDNHKAVFAVFLR